MNKKRQWQMTGLYLWEYRYTALMFLAYAGIFSFVFSLYYLETEAVYYAAGLCILLTGIVLSVHFYFYCRRHREREYLKKNIQLLTDRLPAAKTLAETDYQEMILELKRIFDINLTTWEKERRESMDYYTVWVHQIKTPIAVMRMMLQSEDTKENRELLDELFRIERYVEMVLSYLRLGSETSDFVFQKCSLDEIIRQAVHKYAPQFVHRRIRLFFHPTGLTVLTDKKWLLFIIEQLLSNAIKYTQEGSVTIAAQENQILKIADTGIGIASEDIPRIFEKGFTGYNGRSDKKSTGLGLYLCRMAADKLFYTITVESEVGAGSVFSVDLYRENVDTMP